MCVSLHARKDVEASRKESFAEASRKLHVHIYIYTQKHTDIIHTKKIEIDIDIDIDIDIIVVQGFLPHPPNQKC